MLGKIYISGVGITTARESKILELIDSGLSNPPSDREKLIIFTPNPEQISASAGDPELKSLMNQAQIALPDGIGVVAAARILGKPLYARIQGVDFMEKLISHVSKQPVTAGFLGGQKGVAEEAANCLNQEHPKMSIGYASDIYDKRKMIQSDIDILFVGLGFPKQEKWIMEHKDEVPASVIMAVGGALDFFSGRIPRAPRFLRDVGFEWLFRLIIQPWRAKRQLRLLHFGGLIFWQALSNHLKKVSARG